MLKLNASYSKKVPAEADFTSQSYHASVEIELPDCLSPAELQMRIHETFELVRDSVEEELNQKSALPHGTFTPQNQQNNAPQPTSTQQSKNHVLASPKQLTYLLDLAKNRGVTPQQITSLLNVQRVEDITRKQCSDLITSWKGVA